MMIDKVIVLFLLFIALIITNRSESFAGENFTLSGRIIDFSGQAVEGSEIFIYDDTNTRRPADFITSKSDRDGKYSIQLPAGKYWAVARVRQGEKFGPLLPGAKHSGEPLLIENSGEGEAEQEFIVSDIRDVAKNRQKISDDYVKVTGRIVDESGSPVVSAYVLANSTEIINPLPDYVSAWTDESGRYSIYLPLGSYFIGSAKSFPPDPSMKLSRQLNVVTPKIDIDIDMEITLK